MESTSLGFPGGAVGLGNVRGTLLSPLPRGMWAWNVGSPERPLSEAGAKGWGARLSRGQRLSLASLAVGGRATSLPLSPGFSCTSGETGEGKTW